jgi:ABC-2 type transport system permease protein
VLLFGQLFKRVVAIPGFEASSYVQFLAPGISIMTALFGAAYSGMGLLGDIDRGVLDRLLATPASRGALMAGRILHSAVQVVLQASIILTVAFLVGARPHGGLPGVAVVLLAASLLGAAFAAFSNALALLARRQELVIAVMNFTVLPMTFLSSMLMSGNTMPGWIRGVTRFNPVNWAVTAARYGFEGKDPATLAANLGLLAAFALLCATLATRAFNRYRRAM